MRRLFTISCLLGVGWITAQVPCIDGKSGENDCLGIDLQSHITPPDLGAEELDGNWLNDIWGWVDSETQKEYALVGMTNGTSFVDISDPVKPIVLGILPEHNSINGSARVQHDGAKSIWRDIKVYQNHAYVVSEDPDHGVQVFDLTQLRDVSNPSKENLFSESGHYSGLGQSHNIAINEETGFLYAVGFRQSGNYSCNRGGLHILDLSDPKSPVFAGCFDEDGYTHDAQCVIYRGPDEDYHGMEICFNSNEDEVVIVDVNDKNDMKLISKTTYDGVRYTHQGWLTEDHRFFIHNDELDELSAGHNTRTFIWDVKDLDAPVLLDYFEHDQPSIDHNLYTRGKYIYESNYTSGLVILDTVGISKGSLKKVAFFDTYLSNNAASFSGNWSNYPYFPSGNIVVSDISNGLFVVKMQSIFITTQPEDITACVGEHIDIPVVAQGENISYQWQINEGDGFKNISNFERYINSQTDSLHAHTLDLSQDGFQFRCLIQNSFTELISDTMTIHVIDSPKADFVYELLDGLGNVRFTNTSTNADISSWDFGDGFESDVESPSYLYTESGSYAVELIVSNDCTSDTLSRTVEVIVLSTSDAHVWPTIYPTIVTTELTIESQTDVPAHYAIVSLAGTVVSRGALQGRTTVPFPFASGIYLVKVYVNNQSRTTKIIVQ